MIETGVGGEGGRRVLLGTIFCKSVYSMCHHLAMLNFADTKFRKHRSTEMICFKPWLNQPALLAKH